jgi:alpha-tubulin suppressor-like RCC1 family protein
MSAVAACGPEGFDLETETSESGLSSVVMASSCVASPELSIDGLRWTSATPDGENQAVLCPGISEFGMNYANYRCRHFPSGVEFLAWERVRFEDWGTQVRFRHQSLPGRSGSRQSTVVFASADGVRWRHLTTVTAPEIEATTSITIAPTDRQLILGRAVGSARVSDGGPTLEWHSVGIPARGELSVGVAHSCAVVDSTRRAMCWGHNQWGQLGDGTTDRRLTPTLVEDVRDIRADRIALSTQATFSCAIAGGGVMCWGDDYGVPTMIGGTNGAVAVSVGSFSACAILGTGHVRCWGSNYHGELGRSGADQADYFQAAPPINEVSGAVQVSVGWSHICVLESGGAVKCWGSNLHGELGSGSPSGDMVTPVTVSGLSNARAISAGQLYSCAVTRTGAVKCWGDNTHGQLGNGGMNNAATPVSVSNVSDAVTVSAGSYSACVTRSGGGARCWGLNQYGQLGNGQTAPETSPQRTPVDVMSVSDLISISVGGGHACAISAAGVIKCWGNNEYGALGDGTTNASAVPVLVQMP